MNASTSKDELHFNLPANLTFPDALPAVDAQRTLGQMLVRRVGDALAHMLAFARRGSVMAELNAMDDRELADIGIDRGNLTRVFDTGFAREHVRRGL